MLQLPHLLFVCLIHTFILLQAVEVLGQNVEQFLGGLVSLLGLKFELFLPGILRQELRRNRIGEDHQPGREEQLSTRNDDEQRERYELEEVCFHLFQFHILLVRLVVILVVDLPLLKANEELEVLPEHLETTADLFQFVPDVMQVMRDLMIPPVPIALGEVGRLISK